MAMEKSLSLKVENASFLITADTIVAVGRRILGKTSDKTVARDYLRLLSGRRHYVCTSFCVRHKGKIKSGTVKTTLKMKNLTKEEIEKYLSTKEWKGCAGGYSIQGNAMQFFPFISGCFSNVVGLPLPKLVNVLAKSSKHPY